MREVQCPKGHRLQITDAHLGKQVRCPMCGETFAVPEGVGPATAAGSELGQPPVLAPPPGFTAPLRTPGARTAFWPANGLYVGRPLVLLGLLLVLGARGCDALGKRAVEGARARDSLAQKQFDDAWQEKQQKLEDQRKRFLDAGAGTEESRKELSRIEEQITKLGEDRQKEKTALEKGQWRDQQIKARDAAAKNQLSAYWRECAFVLGTIGLAFGLMIVSWSAQGAERWVSLIMLAIITFSVYVVGLAWTGLPGTGLPM
jgi:hypothetical protein